MDDSEELITLRRILLLEMVLAHVWRERSVVALQVLAVASTRDAAHSASINLRIVAPERLVGTTLQELDFLRDELGYLQDEEGR